MKLSKIKTYTLSQTNYAIQHKFQFPNIIYI